MTFWRKLWKIIQTVIIIISILTTVWGVVIENQILWIPSIAVLIFLLSIVYFKKIDDNAKDIKDIKKDINYYKKLRKLEIRVEKLEHGQER